MFRSLLVTSLLVLVTGQVFGQSGARVQDLTKADAVFPEPFSRIVGVRELSDGRTLIADRTEQHVSYIDFASGSLERIGREGNGPGEYQTPTSLLPLPNDMTLLVDFGNMRTTRITADGKLEDGFSMMQGGDRFIMPGGTDMSGAVYHSSSGMIMVRGGAGPVTPPDSSEVKRWDPGSDASQTVAMLKVTPVQMSAGGSMSSSGGGMRFSGMPAPQPFAPRDDWAVASDGRVAVARAEGYRLDWYAPDGSVTTGHPVDYDPVPITKGEKEAWADAQSQRVMSMRMAGGGGQTMTMPRPDIDDVDFPEYMPPFATSAVRITPDGEVWVQRSQPSSEQRPLFDVFDESGNRVKRVRLPAGRQLVGFGSGWVFAVAVDEDDLQWLERYGR
jgi:hypothetical protein